MMNSDYAPIIIPTLCRFDHFQRCVESLAANKLAPQTELFIGLDYPPSEKYEEGWRKIKEYIPTIKGFKKVETLEATKNLTAQGNIEALKTHIRQLGYKAYVFTEDDNVFSPNFLKYANWGLKEFENDNSVFAVVGFKRVNVDFLKNNVYKYPRYVAWGFATWFNRSDKLNEFKDIQKLKEIVKSWPLSIVFTKRVFAAVSILRMIKTNYILEDTLPSLIPAEEMYCIYPKVSMVRNEGFDGSGLHFANNAGRYSTYLSLPIDDSRDFVPKMEEPLYVPELKKAYGAVYKTPLKKHIEASLKFLIYRLSGQYWRI